MTTQLPASNDPAGESDIRFRKIVEQAPIAMAVVGLDGTIEYINKKAVGVFGYLPQDIPTMDKWWAQAYPDVAYRSGVIADWTGRVQQALAAGSEISGNEYRVTCKDGSIKTMFINGAPVLDKIFVMFDDITGRKEAETKLKEALELNQQVLESSLVGIVIFDGQTGDCVFANQSITRIIGGAVDIIRTQNFRTLPSWRETGITDAAERVLRTGVPENRQVRLHSTFGKVVWVEALLSRIASLGKPVLIFMCQDITERKNSEDALRQSEENFRLLFDENPLPAVLSELPSGKISFVNKQFANVVGKKPADIIGTTANDLGLLKDPRDLDRLTGTILHQGYVDNLEIEKSNANGGPGADLVSMRLVTINGAMHCLTVVHDISDRKRVENELKDSKEVLELIFKISPDAAIITRAVNGLIVDINDKFVKMSGYERNEAVGRTSVELNLYESPESREKIMRELAKTGHCENIEITFRKKNGDRLIGLMSSQVVPLYGAQHVYSIIRDITSMKQTEFLLMNAQKLDALGVLAGGIAHDFNNLLTGIFGYIGLARTLSNNAKTNEYLESTLSTLNRAKALAMQLLTFSKGGAPVQKISPLMPFIQETAQFALSGSNISCTFTVTPDLWQCNIDKNQIGQVIDNMVINASQAMPGGGAIEISVINKTFSEKEHSLLSKGDYVKVSIQDHGAGIPAEMLPRIFDPFYTTKTKGHGLGLATCYSIINRHGGCIEVESEPGKGSTFHFYLPAFPKAERVPEKKAARHQGSGAMILVDDEPVVRETVCKMLEMCGYSVVCMEDGRDALDYFITESKAGEKFAGLMVDLTIPGGMGGKEIIAKIRKIDQKVPVIAISGYADDSVMESPAEHGFTASISKPFSIAEVSDLLERTMGKGG